MIRDVNCAYTFHAINEAFITIDVLEDSASKGIFTSALQVFKKQEDLVGSHSLPCSFVESAGMHGPLESAYRPHASS